MNPPPGLLICRVALLLTFVMLIQSCAPPVQPALISCAGAGFKEVTDRQQRVSVPGVSIVPPSGGDWCLPQPSRYGVGFSTSAFLGKFILTQDDRAPSGHWFSLGVTVLGLSRSVVGSSGELEMLARDWIDAGARSKPTNAEYTFIMSRDPDYRTLSKQTEIARLSGSECVRYETRAVERDKRFTPFLVLDWIIDGYLCRHPDSDDVLVDIRFSERRERGYSNAEFAQQVRAWMEPSIESVEFTPL